MEGSSHDPLVVERHQRRAEGQTGDVCILTCALPEREAGFHLPRIIPSRKTVFFLPLLLILQLSLSYPAIHKGPQNLHVL